MHIEDGSLIEFWDVANTEASFHRYGVEPDFVGLRDALADGRNLEEAYIYVPVSPYDRNGRAALIKFLESKGFFVRWKLGRKRKNGGWKCNFDGEIARDLLRVVWRGRKPDAILVGSGDGDLRPICEVAREEGVQIEIASTSESLAADLRSVASVIVDLGVIIRREIEESRRFEANGAPSTARHQ